MTSSDQKGIPLEKKILMGLYSVPVYLSVKLMNKLGETFNGKPVFTWVDVQEGVKYVGKEVYQCFLDILLVEL